jgi:hypothetical protein
VQGLRDGGLTTGNPAQWLTSRRRPTRTISFPAGFGYSGTVIFAQAGDLNACHLVWTSNSVKDTGGDVGGGDFDNLIRRAGATAVGSTGRAHRRCTEASDSAFPTRGVLP